MRRVAADLRERLRDALGTVRVVYAAERDAQARPALERAGRALAAALGATEEELPALLGVALADLERAAQVVPWASAVLLGALGRLRPTPPGTVNVGGEPFPHLLEDQ